MIRKTMLAVALMCAVTSASAADNSHSNKTLSASEIVEKNIQARGGLSAWHAVQALSFEGKLGAGGNRRPTLPLPMPDKHLPSLTAAQRLPEEAQLPFKMLMHRPRQVRFEIQFKGQTAFQVFDGAHGWKMRPYLNRQDVEPFTADELKAASLQPDLDGPLVDYAAKGTRVELGGQEKVESRDTYKLTLTTKGGEKTHVWVDAQTFLETKVEGQPRRLDGKLHPVEVFYRDYRQVSGLQIPFILETRVLPNSDATAREKEVPLQAEKIVVEKVVVNPKLETAMFSKPEIQTASSQR